MESALYSPRNSEHSSSWIIRDATHTTKAALLPQTYSLVTGGDQARPVERERAVIRSALFVGKEKK